MPPDQHSFCPHSVLKTKKSLLIQGAPSHPVDTSQALGHSTKLFRGCLKKVVGLSSCLPDSKGQMLPIIVAVAEKDGL